MIFNSFLGLQCPDKYIEAQGSVGSSVELRKTYGTFFTTCERDCNSLDDCTAFAYRSTGTRGRESGTCIFYKKIKATDDINEDFLFCKKIEIPCKN